MAKKATALVPVEETALTVHDYGEYAQQGFENQTQEDMSLPFLTILQSNSPQVENDPDKFRAGLLFNTALEEAYPGDAGVIVTPVSTEHIYVEWIPRDSGGGFVGIHKPGSPEVLAAKTRNDRKGGSLKMENGNELQETFQVYGILHDPDGENGQPVLIAFTSTKIKPYKAWMTKLRTYTQKLPDGRKIAPPIFAHASRITTVKQKNQKGSFFNYNISPRDGDVTSSLVPPSHPIFQQALAFRDLIASGETKVNYDKMAGETVEEEGAPY